MWQVLSCHPFTPAPQGWGVWSALWVAGSAGRTPAALGKQLNPCPESVLPLPRWYPHWASLLQEAPERLWVPWSLESGKLRNVKRGVVCRESSPVMLRHPAWGKAASPCTRTLKPLVQLLPTVLSLGCSHLSGRSRQVQSRAIKAGPGLGSPPRPSRPLSVVLCRISGLCGDTDPAQLSSGPGCAALHQRTHRSLSSRAGL